MADFTTTYEVAESESTLPDQGTGADVIDGPAKFLELAVRLAVPVIARKQFGGGGVRPAGGGLSFAVARSNASLRLWKGTGWANEVPSDWFDSVESQGDDPEAIIVKNYVNKRITLPRDLREREGWEIDARVLAAMTTEVKILAHEAIRKSRNIISLLAISWNTRETSSHFLPEIFLEGAQHGNVDQYLQATPNMNACWKALMLTDIASGLAYLHANGIVHCDIKPGNMLVCDSPERKVLESIGLEPVIVKLCDFGCSVILSDYPVHHRFSMKVGTLGWMAPEIEHGIPIELAMLHKVDIFSLGLVAKTILSGVKPYLDVTLGLATDEDVPEVEQDGEASCSPSNSGKENPTRLPKRKAHDSDEEDDLSNSWRVRIEKSESGAERSAWMNKRSKDDSDANDSAAVPRSGSLDEHRSVLLREIVSRTLQPVPLDRKEAKEIYELCRAQLVSKDFSSHGEILGYVCCSFQVPR